MRGLRKAIAIMAACCGLALTGSANAGGVIVGVADQGNCYPFMCNDSGTSVGQSIEYQQVYTSSAFGSTPIAISGLTFYQIFAAQFGGTDAVLAGNYNVSLSTTSVAVNALSTTLSSNVGADSATFFNGSLPTAPFGSSFTITGTAFNYDPTKGNLLMDIVVTNQASLPNGTGNGYNDADDTGLSTSRAYALTNVGNFADGIGLVTGFTFGPQHTVPEPSSFVMAGAAVVMGLGLVRRRRARA